MVDRSDEIARRLAAIVSSSDDAIVSKDLNGTVLSWNDAAERMFGYKAEQIIGRSIRIIIPADRQSEEDAVLESIRAGRRVDHFETVRQTRDGRMIPISLTVSPILDADGKVVGASKIARDISDRKLAEALQARATHRESFLAEVTLTLTRSLDYEQTLRTLAAAATPVIADYCAVDVVEEDGTLMPVAIEHVNPDRYRSRRKCGRTTKTRTRRRARGPWPAPACPYSCRKCPTTCSSPPHREMPTVWKKCGRSASSGTCVCRWSPTIGCWGPDTGQHGIIASAR